jgi:hypothetical protein
MLPSFAQAFASDNMSTTLPPIRKRAVKTADDDPQHNKKRRITRSPHPLRTDPDTINSPATNTANTPMSPVGITVQRDLIDHVRSVKQIRKKQEALIEQRRGSVGALGHRRSHPESSTTPTPSGAAHPAFHLHNPLLFLSPHTALLRLWSFLLAPPSSSDKLRQQSYQRWQEKAG